MKGTYCVVLLSALSFSASARERGDFWQLMEMDLGEMLKVEVATGTEKQLSEAPAVISVVTAEDIIVTGARTLAEAVERVPGLHVSASVNRGADLFTVRGIQSDTTPQILILIDGVDISELSAWPIPYALNYPTNFIERIEIIRGPGSAVYGADAFSGVINVITMDPEGKNEVNAGFNLGSFTYREAWVNADFAIHDFDIALSVTHVEQGNDNDRLTPYGVLDKARDANNLHLNVDYGQYSWKSWWWKGEQKMGVGAGIIGNNFDRDITQTWKTQLNWSGELTENVTGDFGISYSENSLDALFQLFPPGVWPVGSDGNIFGPPLIPVEFPEGIIGQPQGQTNRVRLNSSVIYSGVNNHRLRIGFGYENAELTEIQEFKNFGPGILDTANLPLPGANGFPVSDTIFDVTGTPFVYVPDYERTLRYLSIQDEWKLAADWEFTTGVRYDHYSDFGSTTNPRLALVWNSTSALTTKVLYGTAFRAPKVSELAFVNNPTTLGNPNLRPETIDTFELAFDYRHNKEFSSLLNIFHYQAKDLILLGSDFTFQNIGEQDGYGAELEGNWQVNSKLRINFNLSWLHSELPLTDEDKAQVPGRMAHLDVRYQITDNLLFTAQNYWIANRKRQAGDVRPEVDDYAKTDLTLTWLYKETLNARIGVKNLFNETIVEPFPNNALFALGLGFPDDFPMESRSLFGSLTYKF